MAFDSDTWDPALEKIATDNDVDPKLLKAIARQENVAPADYNPLGISPHDGPPTHYANMEAGLQGMADYVSIHRQHFQDYQKNPAAFAEWYSPSGAGNDPNQTNATELAGIQKYMGEVSGASGQLSYQKSSSTPIQQLRQDYPEFSEYSDEQLLTALKPKIAPEMKQEDFNQAAYSPDGFSKFKSAAASMTLMQQARTDFPQWSTLNDAQFQNRLYKKLVSSGKLDPTDISFDSFKTKLTPPNNVLTWLSNSVQDWSDRFKSSFEIGGKQDQQIINEAIGTLQQSSAGFYGAVQGASDITQSTLAMLDKLGKAVGLPAGIQQSYNDFNARYLKTPFDDYFRKGVAFLNQKAQEQRVQAQASFQKAKGISPVAKVAGDIAGSIPEMAATFGLGTSAQGATKAEQIGRALWATVYQASSATGKQVETTARQQFLSSYRSGLTAALQSYLFSSPYGRLTTGLMNSLLGADVADIQNWLQGRPSHIEETAISTTVNFALGYGMGHDKMNEASAHDLLQAQRAQRAGDIKRAKDLVDRAFVLMPEDESIIHASNIVTLTDLLGDNTGNINKIAVFEKPDVGLPEKPDTQPYPGDIANVQGDRKPVVSKQLKEQIKQTPAPAPQEEPKQTITLEQPASIIGPPASAIEQKAPKSTQVPQEQSVTPDYANKVQSAYEAIKAEQNGLSSVSIGKLLQRVGGTKEDLHSFLREQASAGNADLHPTTLLPEQLRPEDHAAALTIPRKGQNERAVKVTLRRPTEVPQEVEKPPSSLPGPLRKQDVDRFTDHFYMGDRSQMGSVINPAQLIQETGQLVKEAWLGVKKIGEKIGEGPVGEFSKAIQATFRPSTLSERSAEAASEVGRAINHIDYAKRAYLNNMFQRLTDDELLTDLDLLEKRSAYIKKYSTAQQRDMLVKASKGEKTGDPIYDRMEEVHQEAMKGFAERENRMGLTYDIRDTYIYQVGLKKLGQKKMQEFMKGFSVRYPDPTFMHHRSLQDFEHALKMGYELPSNDPNFYHQLRVADHFKNVWKIQLLEQWKDQGNAYETTQEGIPEEAKDWTRIRSPQRKEGATSGTAYLVHPEKALFMKRAFDPMFTGEHAPLLQASVGNLIHWAKVFKGLTVPIRLWSMAHLAHIPQIRLGLRQSYLLRNRMLDPEAKAQVEYGGQKFDIPRGTLSDLAQSLIDEATWGVQQMVRDQSTHADLLDVLQGKKLPEDLTMADQWAMKQVLDSGFSPGLSHEREIQMGKWLGEQLPDWMRKQGLYDPMSKFGDQIINGPLNFQKHVFGDIIPAVKLASLMERINDLYTARPELLDQANNPQRIQELRKLAQNVDLKLGEMNYNVNFAPKWLKGVGIGTFLSLSWQIGLLDYAGGLKDLAANPLHWQKIQEAFKQNGVSGAARQIFSDRALTSLFYTASAMTTGALLTYLNMATRPDGWKHKFEWRDFFFPWAGKKPNGEDARWRMMAFPGELLSIGQRSQSEGVDKAIGDTVRNKLNSNLATAFQALANANYLGQKISDDDWLPHGLRPTDFQHAVKGAWDRAQYMFVNTFTPIGMSAWSGAVSAIATGDKQAPQKTEDAIAAFFGFNQAPAWTGRTPLANEIMGARDAQGKYQGMSVAEQNRSQAKRTLRDALLNGTHDDVVKAIRDGAQQGLSRKQMEAVARDRHIATDKWAFRELRTDTQVQFLQRMNEEQRREYWKFVHKDAKKEFLDWRSQHEHQLVPAQ